jgi:hypothetical protein
MRHARSKRSARQLEQLYFFSFATACRDLRSAGRCIFSRADGSTELTTAYLTA